MSDFIMYLIDSTIVQLENDSMNVQSETKTTKNFGDMRCHAWQWQ